MDPFGIGITGLGAAGAATFGAFGLAFRARRRRLAARAAASELAITAATAPLGESGALESPLVGEPAAVERRRSDRDRIEAIATAQAELALRLDALTAAGSAPEEKLQAMAGQLLGLIRDKNATLETAMTGLDQLRARMKALEEMGEPAEARGLFEGLKSRMGELENRAAANAAVLEARIAALASGGGASELAERLARLHEARDAGLEAALARLAPLETRLAGLESGIGAGREATKRLEAALSALQGEQVQARTEIAALRATAETAPVRAEARVDALRAELSGRIEAFERALVARDPQGALDRLADRLEAVQDRVILLETAENPLAEVSERLTALYVQKDAAVEAVLGRLAPLEARLHGFEREIAAKDPQGALDRFAERLETVQDRLMLIEATENPLAEVSEKLTALYAQKDAAVEAVLGRLAPLETRLGGVEREIAGLDPQAALDRLAARVEAVQGRVSLIETAENPLAEITERLAQIHAQKEAAVEAVLSRLGPLEARLGDFEREIAAKDPAVAIEQLVARVEAVQGRVWLLETAETPLAEISEKLAALHTQKDTAVETVLARLGPIEERVAGFERAIAAKDPQGALDRFAERLEGVAGRVSLIETAESPLAELSETLAQLHAQKEAAVEAVIARLGPVEDRLGGVEREIAAKDPQGALDRFAERLEAVQSRLAVVETSESPLAEVTETLAGLYAQKEAAVEAVISRLAPLEARLADFELDMSRQDPQGALDRFAERLEAVQGRVSFIETAPAPLAEVTETLAALYAQKEAAVEAVLSRLTPLEAKLASVEGDLARTVEQVAADEARAAMDGLRSRIEALQWGLGETAAGLAALKAETAAAAAGSAVEAGFGEVADQLSRALAQKDATLSAILDRLGPLEVMSERFGPLEIMAERLGPLEAMAERLGPLEAMVERLGPLEILAARLGPLEIMAERLGPLETMAERLGTVEAAVDRLGPVEGAVDRIGRLEARMGRLGALETTVERLAALETTVERLGALETTLGRLAPLEARLVSLESRDDPEAARAMAGEVAVELAALRADAAAQTALFANRLAMLEATMPRLDARQAALMRAAEGGLSGLASSGSVASSLAASGPVASGPATSSLAPSGPVASGPVASGPATSGPAVSGPAATTPATSLETGSPATVAGTEPPTRPAPEPLIGPVIEPITGTITGTGAASGASEEEAIWALPRIISLHK